MSWRFAIPGDQGLRFQGRVFGYGLTGLGVLGFGFQGLGPQVDCKQHRSLSATWLADTLELLNPEALHLYTVHSKP